MTLKTITFFLLAAANFNSAHATEQASKPLILRNPLIRVCITNGGTFETHPVGTDEFAFCRWNRAVIDSQTLLSNLNGVQSEAAGLMMSDTIATSCADVGASSLSLDSTPDRQEVCLFTDGSMLAIETISADLTNIDRNRLKDVLLGR